MHHSMCQHLQRLYRMQSHHGIERQGVCHAAFSILAAIPMGMQKPLLPSTPLPSKRQPLPPSPPPPLRAPKQVHKLLGWLKAHGPSNSGILLQGLILLFVATALGIVGGVPVMIAKRRGKHTGAGDKGIIEEVKELLFGKQAHSS